MVTENDDFTEDFEDEALPEDFEEEAPAPKQAPRRPAPAPAPPQRGRPQQQPQRQQVQAPASAPVQTQQVRYVPFELPARIGIFDNNTGKPLMEESPRNVVTLDSLKAQMDVLFGAITELMNKVTELEKDI